MLDDLKSISSSDLTLVHYASGFQIRLGTLIKLAVPLILLATIIVVFTIYKRTNARKALRSRIKRTNPSALALLGLEVSDRQQRQWSI